MKRIRKSAEPRQFTEWKSTDRMVHRPNWNRLRAPQYSDLQLEYRNLLCSCLRERSSGEPVHCGHRKGSWFDAEALVSPLQQDCETRFIFTANGEIYPRSSSDLAAATTIESLALDLPKLNALRAAALDGLCDLSPPDVQLVLNRGQDGSFPEYFTTIKDVLL